MEANGKIVFSLVIFQMLIIYELQQSVDTEDHVSYFLQGSTS